MQKRHIKSDGLQTFESHEDGIPEASDHTRKIMEHLVL